MDLTLHVMDALGIGHLESLTSWNERERLMALAAIRVCSSGHAKSQNAALGIKVRIDALHRSGAENRSMSAKGRP